MELRHRRILESKSRDISVNVNLEDLKPLLKNYKIFNEYMWKDINSTYDVFKELPYRGPKAFQNIIEILRKVGYNAQADCLENAIDRQELQYYKMSSEPLGYCLIIYNMNFEKPKRYSTPDDDLKNADKFFRYGSDVDAKSFENFFIKIGYRVTVEHDMKRDKMQECLQQFSKRNFRDVDSAVIIILSHGTQKNNLDAIRGTDHETILKKDIIKMFNNENCPQLLEKPKVFFFIACRGSYHDRGVLKTVSSDSTDNMDYDVPKMNSFMNTDIDVTNNDTLPSDSDIFVIHSTLPDCVSLRDHKGSYFCQEFISVLDEYHSMWDLHTVITKVNSKLVEKISPEYRLKQVAHLENKGATKLLMFCKTSSDIKI